MMAPFNARLFVSLLSLALIAGTVRAATYPALFTYGDSWVDSNGVLGTWKLSRMPPTPPNARVFSNGPTWPHYLAKNMGLDCPFSNFNTDAGVNCSVWRNYGTGAACSKYWGLSPSASMYCEDRGINLPNFYPDQVRAHTSANVSAALNRDGLHIISIGGNDLMMTFFFGGGDPLGMINKTTETRVAIKEGVQELYDAGARNFYLVNMVPLMLLPGSRDLTDAMRELADEFVQLYAEDYHDNVVVPLRARLTDATITEINLLGCMYTMNANCEFKDLGFDEWIKPCIEDRNNASTPVCSNPSKRVWWDDAHPTTAFHEVLATKFKEVIDGKSGACLLTGCLGDSLLDRCPGGNDVCSAAAPGGMSFWTSVGAVLLAVLSLGLGL